MKKERKGKRKHHIYAKKESPRNTKLYASNNKGGKNLVGQRFTKRFLIYLDY